MKIEELLFEKTYDLSFVEEIVDYIGKILRQKNKQKLIAINITNLYPKEYNPHNFRVMFYYKKINDVDSRSYSTLKSNKDVIIIKIDEVFTPFYYSKDERFGESLYHEIIHSLDLLKMKKGTNIVGKNIDLDPSNKVLQYWSDDLEFNQIIHNLKRMSEEHKRAWNNINTVEDIYKFIKNQNDLFHMKADKQVLKDKFFKKRLLARLTRENLLPPNLKI